MTSDEEKQDIRMSFSKLCFMKIYFVDKETKKKRHAMITNIIVNLQKKKKDIMNCLPHMSNIRSKAKVKKKKFFQMIRQLEIKYLTNYYDPECT